MLAWELGCKGITVYVTGSRDKVVLETHATAEKKQAKDAAAPAKPPPHPGAAARHPASRSSCSSGTRPRNPARRSCTGYTYSIETPLGKTFITINENGGSQPFEVFLNTAKAGSDTAAVSEAIGRLISYILRMASPIEPVERLHEVVAPARRHRRRALARLRPQPRALPARRHRPGPRALPGHVERAPDAKSRRLPSRPRHGNGNGNGHGPALENARRSSSAALFKIGDLCPECGEASVVNEEGCRKCYSCGYSEC